MLQWCINWRRTHISYKSLILSQIVFSAEKQLLYRKYMLDCIHIEYISLLVESFSYSSFNLACIQWSFLEKASLHLYPTFSQFGCVKILASAIFFKRMCLWANLLKLTLGTYKSVHRLWIFFFILYSIGSVSTWNKTNSETKLKVI